MHLLQRLRNIWKLGGIQDLEFVEPSGFKWTGWIKPEVLESSETKVVATMDFPQRAQIIRKYVDPIDEINGRN